MYCIDLEDKRLSIMSYPKDSIQADLEAFGLSRVKDLEDFDWRLFKTERQASKFLRRYRQALKSLKKLPAPKGLSCLLYKRRYLALAAMKVKKWTERDYFKNISVGEIFYFHDQTFFVKARMTRVEQQPGGYKYFYEILH